MKTATLIGPHATGSSIVPRATGNLTAPRAIGSSIAVPANETTIGLRVSVRSTGRRVSSSAANPTMGDVTVRRGTTTDLRVIVTSIGLAALPANHFGAVASRLEVNAGPRAPADCARLHG